MARLAKPRFLGFTPDGRRRYAYDYASLPPIMGGADPTSDDQVNTNLGDVHELEDTGGITDSDVGIILRSSSVASSRYWMGLWFQNGPFPAQGATIDVAYFQLYFYDAIYDDPNADFYAHDAASPPIFTTSAFDVTSRPRTTASAAWAANDLGSGWKQSPSIVSVIQELVDSYSPTAITLIGKPRSDLAKRLYTRPYNYDPTLAAKLHLEWTEGGVQTLTPAPVAAPFAVPDPTVSPGASPALTPSPVTLSTQIPSVAVTSPVTVLPDPVTLPLAVVDPTVSPGAIALALEPVTVPIVIVAPTLVAGGLLSPAPVTIPLVVVDPTVVSSVALSPTPVELPFAVPDSQLMPVVSLSPAPVTIPFSVPDPSISAGIAVLAPASAVATWAIPAHILVLAGAEAFTQFGNITRLIVGADFPSSASFFFEAVLKTRDPARTAKAYLYNITDGSIIAGSELSTTSTTAVRLRSAALSLPTGAKEYRAEFGGDGGGVYTCYTADVIVDSG